MYADVVLDQATGPLTYHLTPETLLDAQVGKFVKVPIGDRLADGIIWNLHRNASSDFKDKTRPLHSIQKIKIPASTIRLASLIAQESAETLGAVLWRLLPSPKALINYRTQESTSEFRRLHCYGSFSKRLAQYCQLVRAASLSGKQTIIVAPAWRHQEIQAALADLGKLQVVTASSKRSEINQAASDLALGEIQILISTRFSLGWPMKSAGTIIVDDPLHLAHTENQRPYLDSATIALLRGQAENLYILLGFNLPNPGSLAAELIDKANRIKSIESLPAITFSKIDRPGLSNTCKDEIEKGNQVAIIAPRTGLGGTRACWGCDFNLTCKDCGGELKIATQEPLACYDCGIKQFDLKVCPKCGGLLRDWGIGTEAIEAQVKKEFGEIPKNVWIGTSNLLENEKKFDTIFFAYSDSPLVSPDLERPWRWLGAINEATDQADKVFVETRNPENPIWQIFGSSSLNLIQTLLTQRKNNNLPPFFRRIWVENSSKLPGFRLNPKIQIIDRSDMMELLVPAHIFHQALRFVRSQVPRKIKIKVDSLITP